MSATTVDYCIAVDQATGGNTTSKASAYLTADNFGSGEGSVKDNVLDNLYPAARFVFAVNGVVIYDLLYGVPDGGSVRVVFPSVGGAYEVEVVSEGYVGTLDSRADAIALWSPQCPV